jgi:hypothetical protein
MIHPKVAAEMSGRDFFSQALKDSISDVLWYGVGTVVIILLGSLSWWLGVVLSGLFAVIVLVSVIQTGAVTVLGLASIPLAIDEKRQGRCVDRGEQVYLAVANVIKILDKAILVAYTYVLYRVYF